MLLSSNISRAAQQKYDPLSMLEQNSLGWSYLHGLGVEKDFNKAVHWYERSTEQGNASAQYNLGNCYYNELGVKIDIQMHKDIRQQ